MRITMSSRTSWTFVDRGPMPKLAQPTVLPSASGSRLAIGSSPAVGTHAGPGCFSHIAAQNPFTKAETYADTLAALQLPPKDYGLGSLRYELSKLRAKGRVDKLPHGPLSPLERDL
jgi:hypothetical protein